MVRLLRISDTERERGTAIIAGPRGCVEIHDLVWLPADRADLIELCYWSAWSATQGVYHCCFSWPGKVSLLTPDDPQCDMRHSHDKPHDGHFP